MTKRVATLLGLVGLAGLLCLVAALTSGCGLPVTRSGFQQNLAHGLGPFHGRIDALDRKVAALEESTAANFAVVDKNFEVFAGGVEQATRRAEAAKNLGETIVKKLGPIGRDVSIASKEAAAGKKAAEAAGTKIVDAQKELGEKIDTATATTATAVTDVGRKIDTAAADATTAHAALDQKLDRRADELVGAVAGVDRKVDATKTAAEAAASGAGAAAKAGADVIVEVGKIRKELSDHASKEERGRQAISRLLSLITPPPPAPGHP